MASTKDAVVIGVAGLHRSEAALVLGTAEATRRHAPIVLLHTWGPLPLLDGSVALVLADIEAAEATVLTDAAERVQELAPSAEVRTRLVQGTPGEELVRASHDAALVVVARSLEHRSWLGHVLGRLTSTAGCPVISVPSSRPTGAGERAPVVVGVDGSACSLDAIGFAFDEADAAGSPLVAVRAVELSFDAYVPAPSVLESLLERGRCELSESLAGWSEKHPDVQVRQLVCLGSALSRLQEAGADARLVVVGSHGRGLLGRGLFGSVSSSLLRDAPCPVAVVRTA